MFKSVILLSSGLDSSVNLAVAKKKTEVILAITFNYGQKAAAKEIECSKNLAKFYDVQHKVLDISWLKEITDSSLVSNKSLPSPDIFSKKDTIKSAESVWVSNRNGLFINIAACYAEYLSAQKIIVGFNVEEAATFSDNTKEFIKAINNSLRYSAKNVEVDCYTTEMNKKEIMCRAREIKLPIEMVWPCYKSGENICGKCESCKRFINAGG